MATMSQTQKNKDHIFKMYTQYTELLYLPDYIHMTLLK